jgi:hypothetical protein
MELVAVLLLCAMTALVLLRVVSRPSQARNPDEHRRDARITGTPQVRRRAF